MEADTHHQQQLSLWHITELSKNITKAMNYNGCEEGCVCVCVFVRRESSVFVFVRAHTTSPIGAGQGIECRSVCITSCHQVKTSSSSHDNNRVTLAECVCVHVFGHVQHFLWIQPLSS